MSLNKFFDEFRVLNDDWGWPAVEGSQSPEEKTHVFYLGTPWQGLTDCLMRSLYKGKDPHWRNCVHLLDTLERPLTISDGELTETRVRQYLTYLREIGPFFIEHESILKSARLYLQGLPMTALKIGFLIQVRWQLYVKKKAQEPVASSPKKDLVKFGRVLRNIAFEVSQDNGLVPWFTELNDDNIEEWYEELRDLARADETSTSG
jgi:hypothetical protein